LAGLKLVQITLFVKKLLGADPSPTQYALANVGYSLIIVKFSSPFINRDMSRYTKTPQRDKIPQKAVMYSIELSSAVVKVDIKVITASLQCVSLNTC